MELEGGGAVAEQREGMVALGQSAGAAGPDSSPGRLSGAEFVASVEVRGSGCGMDSMASGRPRIRRPEVEVGGGWLVH